MSQVYIALLRGINVGGHNRLPMKQLTAIVEGIGGQDARTYIQSGNVVFRASEAVGGRAAADITDAIQEQVGISPPVVLRTVKELRSVVAANPYLGPGQDESALSVAFLAAKPAASAVAALDPRRSPPDEFMVHGREIYLRCPNGVARSKLTNAYFDSRLATVSTARNWRTTLKVLAMAESAGR